MKRFDSPALTALGAVMVTAWFAACGGLNDGEITIVDSGGSAGSGGSSSNDGGTQSSGGDAGSDGARGGEGGEPPVVISDEPPVVVSVTPEDEASDIEPDAEIEIEFSETLDPETVTSDSIVVRDGDRIVSGELDFSGTTATFTPDESLTLLANLSVTVTTGVTDLEGTELEEEFVSSFQVREGSWGHQLEFNNADQGIQPRFAPAPALDAQGNALLVWAQASVDNPSLEWVIWGRFFTRGEGWGESFRISTDGLESRSPAVAMDATGDAIVSWVQVDGSYQRVYARRYVAGTWEESPQRVDNTDHDSVEYVTAAISPVGEMHVAWRAQSTLSSYYTLYGNQVEGLASWDSEGDTYRYGSYEGIGGPSLAFDPEGNGLMVWFANDGTNPIDVRVGRYVKGAADPWKSSDWIPPGAGVPNIDYNNAPEIVTDADGGAMVVWKTNSAEVASSRFTKATGWSDAVPLDVSSDNVSEFGPRIARTGDEFVTAWIQDVEGVTNFFSNRHVDGAWQTMPDLVSDGVASLGPWGGIGFGLDRNGNGIGAFSQDGSVRAARLIGATWSEDIEIDTPMNGSSYPVMEVNATVAPNGVAIVTYAAGYAWNQSHDHLYVVVFE
jgi:hypothetical protein